MNEPVQELSRDDVPVPDVSQLVTEDDTPVDNVFSEKQMRLLTEPLYAGWDGPPGNRSFVACANVGVFATATNDPLVPDVFLSLDTSVKHPLSEKSNRSYFIWEHGKPPDVVIEVVSNTQGGELDRKVYGYERMRVVHYVVFDPFKMLGDVLVTRFELVHGTLVQQAGDLWLPSAGLGLVLWEGAYESEPALWLRWCREDRALIATGAELARAEGQRAEAEKQRAERLAARLRELGIDPDE